MTALILPFFEDRAMADKLQSPGLQKFQDNGAKRAIPRELLEQLTADKFTGQLVIRNPFDE